MIVDCSGTYGNQKMRLILGVELAHFDQHKEEGESRKLDHTNVKVLSAKPVKTATGEAHFEEMEKVVKTHGYPLSVVTDGGTDIQLANQKLKNHLAKSGHELVCVYDVSHKIARLLCRSLQELKGWPDFESFLSQLRRRHDLSSKIFCPPNLKHSPDRWMNFGPIVKWVEKIQMVIDQLDTDALPPSYGLTQSAYDEVRSTSRRWGKWLSKFEKLIGKTWDSKAGYEVGLRAISKKAPEALIEKLLDYPGPNEEILAFIEKELKNHSETIGHLKNMMAMCREVKEIFDTKGLSHASLNECDIKLRQNSCIGISAKFNGRLTDYIWGLQKVVGEGQTLIASSDIIESIFGKWKHWVSQNPRPSLGANVALPSLIVEKPTEERISENFAKTTVAKLREWLTDQPQTFAKIRSKIFGMES